MFRTSTPVTDHSFFDREQELGQLSQAVQQLREGAPQWVALLGSRKVGKTSLLMELSRRCRDEETRFVILDSFEDGALSLGLFRRLALRVVDAFFASELGVSVEALAARPADYQAALMESKQLPRLSRALRTDLLGLAQMKADARLVELSLGLAERLASELEKWCVIAWDEFQELARLKSGTERELLAVARAIWQRHQRTAYLISGSERSMMQELISSKASPFFQHFSPMELGPMPEVEAVRMLVKSAPVGRAISETIARRAIALLGGHPFYLQLFGETLTALEPPYDESSVQQAIAELLFQRTGRLALYFARQHESAVGRAATLAAVLDALAAGPARLSEIASRIGASSGSTVRYLDRLGELVLHRREEALYELADPVFALWLRWRRPGGSVVPLTLMGNEAELEVARQLALMGFELVYQSRASRGAFDLLGVRNGEQLAIQVKRSGLPLRFSKPEWQRLKADSERLGWPFVVAAVSPEGEGGVSFLAPSGAQVRRAVTLGAAARIENLLAWMEVGP